jgi:transcriptional regulator with XRE-family HTH domain
MELEGCSAPEIAARLGMTPGAVGNILSKAHRQGTEQTAKAMADFVELNLTGLPAQSPFSDSELEAVLMLTI